MEKYQWMASLIIITLLLVVVISLVVAENAFSSIREMPPFTLYTLEGKEMDFPSSSWAILYFFSSDCFSCFNTLLEFQQKTRGLKNVLFFPVCTECDWKMLKNLQESLPSGFTVYFLSPQERAILGIWNTPSLFLLSPTGKVVERWDNNIKYKTLEKLLETVTTPRSSPRKNSKSPCTSEGICE